MTAVTHPTTDAIRRSTLRDLVRRSTSGLASIASRVTTKVADLAAAGQLGPDAETEVGRWTGARV